MKRTILNYFKKMTDMLAASAFAELGAVDAAHEILAAYGWTEGSGEWEKDQTAITFAESGEFDTAREILSEHEKHPTVPDDCRYGDNDLCYSQA
jgi:hypothetical protein